VPEEEVRRLRADGHSLAEVAERAGTTVAKVRRIVGKVDTEGQRRRQEEIARAIDGEPLTWGEKVARWKHQTGRSGATFWRVLRRVKAKT
jgi:hypothetical protein